MANELSIKEKIAAHKAKPVALTRKQTAAAREELKKLTETHAPKVIETLASFVKDKRIPASSRVAAGNIVLERYAGKASKLEEEQRPEDSYSRMSQGELLGVICDSLWGMSSEARAVIAETLVAAEQGLRVDTAMMGRDFDEEEAQRVKMEKPKAPKREPRR